MARRWIIGATLVALHCLLSVVFTPVIAQTPGQTTLVSVSMSGGQGNGLSNAPVISADGRYVAFDSGADNLVSNDTNAEYDVFVRDRLTNQTKRVSISSGGEQGNKSSRGASISADGRYIAFESVATNLVIGDTNGAGDIFVHDQIAGLTIRVSVNNFGEQGSRGSWDASISANGRYVAYTSDAWNLVPDDTNGGADIFRYDRQLGQIIRVSVGTGSVQSDGNSETASMSADGRYIAFASVGSNLVVGDDNNYMDIFVHDAQDGHTNRVSLSTSGDDHDGYWTGWPAIAENGCCVVFHSGATNLVAGDTNNTGDVFVYDRTTGQTSRVSVSSTGAEGNDWSEYQSISANGRYVAFGSDASNLVAGDTNYARDIFVHDRQTGQTTRVSVWSSGQQGSVNSWFPVISANGRYVAFDSDTCLAPECHNVGLVWRGAYVHDRWPPVPSAPDAVPQKNRYATTTPLLTWNPVTSATGYEVQVSTSTAFSLPLDFQAELNADEWEVSVMPPLTNQKTYYWRVRARLSNGGWGAWSAMDSFVIDVP